MKPLNVTTVVPPWNVHALALKEAADYLHEVIKQCGFRSIRSINTLSDECHNIICCAHLLSADQIKKIPPDSIIFNSEPLDDPEERRHFSDAYAAVLQSHYIWDYSSLNLPRIGHDRTSVIPFLGCAALRRTDVVRTEGSAILFYGRLTPRREHLLNQLRGCGVPLRVMVGKYAEERDAAMFGCRAVLNLHKTDVGHAFESIRCFYPLINGVPVISEITTDPASAAFADSVFFFDQASLALKIRALYDDPEHFRARSRSMCAAFQRKDPVPAMTAAIEEYRRRLR